MTAARLGAPRLRRFAREGGAGERRATWLELFFDLVFVVAVAELAGLLHHDPTPGGFLAFAGLFVPVWWAWMGFTFYADQFDADDAPSRLALLAAMPVVAALAIGLHGVVEGHAGGFALAYAATRLLLAGLYLRAYRGDPETRALTGRFVAGYGASAALWLLSLAAPEPARFALWGVGLAIEMAAPVLGWRALGEAVVADRSHATERIGLFTVIVLGESVVAVAAGTTGIGWGVRPAAVALLGFAAAAAAWWLYFGRLEGAAIRPGLASSFLYGYGHLPLLAALAAFAVGVHLAIEHAGDAALDGGSRAALCGGAALYLAAVTLAQRITVRSIPDAVLAARLGAALGAVLLAVIGGLGTLPLMGLLAVLLAGLVLFEAAHAQGAPAARGGDVPAGAGPAGGGGFGTRTEAP